MLQIAEQFFLEMIVFNLLSESLYTSLASGIGSLSCAAKFCKMSILLFLFLTSWKPSESCKGVSGTLVEVSSMGGGGQAQ